MTQTWHGVFPAAATLFRDDESIDLDATLAHLSRLLDAGVDGLVLLGTVGENCSLEAEEKLDVLAAARRRVSGSARHVPLLTGVAETTTRQACRFARQCAEIGVDGLMVLPAMVYRSTASEAVHHMLAVADASPLPVMLYNNPVSYGVDLRPQDFAAFVDERRIVAIKESSDDPRRINDLRRLHGDRFALFCGVDDLVMESFPAGLDGWVSGLVDAFPEENVLLWALLRHGAWTQARELYRWLAPLLHLDTLPRLVQCIKLAMAETGLGSERCRSPRLPLEGDERARVLEIVRTAMASRPNLMRLRREAGLAT